MLSYIIILSVDNRKQMCYIDAVMKQEPIYCTIKRYLLSLIEENKDKESYMLPSESQLCLKFGASRVPVRRAVSELEAEKVIVKHQGKGTFVNREIPPAEKAEDGRLIALILPDISTNFLQKITLGVRHYCERTKNRYILLPSFSLSQTEQDNIRLAMELNCHGILLMPVDEDSYNDELLKLIVQKKPCIFLDRKLIGLNIPSVSSDHEQMGYLAAKTLLDKGVRKIAYFAQTDMITSINERVRGYLRALDEYKNPAQYVVNITGIKGETLHEKMLYFFTRNPEIDGIIINSGIPTANAIRALSAMGKIYKKDYFVVSFDDNNLLIDLSMNIETENIVQDAYKIGYTACELLLKQIVYGSVPQQKTVVPLLVSNK